MTETNKSFRSLSKTIRLTTLAGLVVFSGALGTELFFNFETQTQLIATEQRLIAKGAADTVRNFVSEQSRILDQAVDVNSLADDPTRRELVFGKLIGRNPSIRNVLLIDATGSVLLQTSRFSNSGIPVNAWQKAVLKETAAGKTYISSVYIDPVTNEPLVVIAVPAKDKFKDPRGALVAVIDLKFMWDLVDSIKVGTSGAAYVVDENGYLLAYKDTSLVLARRNISDIPIVYSFVVNDTTVTNDDFIGFSRGLGDGWFASSHQHLDIPNWAVVVETPAQEAYGSILRVGVISIIIIIIGLLLVSLLSSYITRTIIQPIIHLRDVVKEIGTTNLRTRIDIPSRDEIGELAGTFNAMTMRLAQSYDDLVSEKARLLASINSLSFGFVLADVNGVILLKNPALTQILSLIKEPKTITDVGEIFKATDYALDFDVSGSCQKCMELQKPVEFHEVSFGKKFLRIICLPVLTKTTTIGFIFLVEDITEAKVMERSREEFFAVASHELRTPLTAIRGNADMILDMYADKIVDKDMKDMLTDIDASSVRLIDIVNDFLEVSRLEQGKITIKLETFDVVEVIEKAVRNLSGSVTGKGLVLTNDTKKGSLPQVRADKDRTEQILMNLVGNAAKFTQKGGIQVSACRDDAFVRVRVTDTGAGISEHNQTLLFRKFQQAGEQMLARDVTQSTGLGLYISRLIISNMGGTIGLEKSELGKGSTFTFTLPIGT